MAKYHDLQAASQLQIRVESPHPDEVIAAHQTFRKDPALIPILQEKQKEAMIHCSEDPISCEVVITLGTLSHCL